MDNSTHVIKQKNWNSWEDVKDDYTATLTPQMN